MATFSERQGILKRKIQRTSMDNALRNGLWNVLKTTYLDNHRERTWYQYSKDDVGKVFAEKLWLDHFKQRIDIFEQFYYGSEASYSPTTTWIEKISQLFFKFEWNEVYDLIEFFVNNYPRPNVNKECIEKCNIVLEKEISAYRFVGTQLIEITSPTEIKTIEEALDKTKTLKTVNDHIIKAINLLDRKNPDYSNSIKESISAVELVCELIVGEKTTLGQALNKLEKNGKIKIHGALKNAFCMLYGWTSDDAGIRHANFENSEANIEEANLILVNCCSFITYLLIKAQKAGIKLTSQ